MKSVLYAIALLVCAIPDLTQVITYPTLANGQRDYSKPATETTANGETYTLNKNGDRDYTKPATKTGADGLTYQVLPNGERDYRALY